MKKGFVTNRRRKAAGKPNHLRFGILLPAFVLSGALISVQSLESAPSGSQAAAQTAAPPAVGSEPSEPQEPIRDGFNAGVVLPADFRRHVVEAVHRILFQIGEDPEDFAVEIVEDPVLFPSHTRLHRSLEQPRSEVLQTARLAGVVVVQRNGRTLPPDRNHMRMFTVGLESEDGRTKTKVYSNLHGAFKFGDLEAGRYRIIIRAKGYKTAISSVLVAPGERRIIEAVLEEGDQDEVVRSQAQNARPRTSDLLLRFVDGKGNWLFHVYPKILSLRMDEFAKSVSDRTQADIFQRSGEYFHTSTASGLTRYRDLPPGTYRLRIEIKGFKPAFSDIQLESGETRFLVLQLERGAGDEMIEIKARETLAPAKKYLAASLSRFSSIRDFIPAPLAYARAVACGRFNTCRPFLVYWDGTAIDSRMGGEFERDELERVHRELEPAYQILADISKGPERFYPLLDEEFVQGMMEMFRNSDDGSSGTERSLFRKLAQRPWSLSREVFSTWLCWVTLDQWQRFELGSRFEGPQANNLQGVDDPEAWLEVWRTAMEEKRAEFQKWGHFHPDHLRQVSSYFKKFLSQGVISKQTNAPKPRTGKTVLPFLPESFVLYKMRVGDLHLFFSPSHDGLKLVLLMWD